MLNWAGLGLIHAVIGCSIGVAGASLGGWPLQFPFFHFPDLLVMIHRGGIELPIAGQLRLGVCVLSPSGLSYWPDGFTRVVASSRLVRVRRRCRRMLTRLGQFLAAHCSNPPPDRFASLDTPRNA